MVRYYVNSTWFDKLEERVQLVSEYDFCLWPALGTERLKDSATTYRYSRDQQADKKSQRFWKCAYGNTAYETYPFMFQTQKRVKEKLASYEYRSCLKSFNVSSQVPAFCILPCLDWTWCDHFTLWVRESTKERKSVESTNRLCFLWQSAVPNAPLSCSYCSSSS